MTAASGEPGDTSRNEGMQSSTGAYEAPPIEQIPTFQPPPAYGGYEPPSAFPPSGQPGFAPPGYPPAQGYPPPAGYVPTYAPPPEYGPPYPGGYGTPTAPPDRTNSLAAFSLVASAVGLLCGIGSIIGIVLGVIALNQIKRTGQQGRGLAVTGIVVGVVSMAISIVAFTFFLNSPT
ncbi:MAG: DUF4190 domain-containing protein [Mycobacterium sp.]